MFWKARLLGEAFDVNEVSDLLKPVIYTLLTIIKNQTRDKM